MVGNLFIGPQPAHQTQRFGTTGAALRHPGPEGFTLLRAVTQPDAQNEAPLRDVVQSRNLLGDLHRIQQRQQQDRGGQFHVSRLGGQPRQHRPGLEMLERVDQVMVGPAIDVEPSVA